MTDFSIHSGKGHIEEAEEAVEEGLERISDVLPKEDELDIDIGWTSQDFVVDEMGGTTGKAINSGWIEIKFNSGCEDWRKNLISTTVHEYVHSWFYEKDDGRSKLMWKYVLEEALTQHFSKKLVPEAEHVKQTKFGRDDIAEHWSQIREEEIDRTDPKFYKPLFINRGDSQYPNWLGYSLSYLIGQKLMEEYEPEEFPELGKDEVINAGDELFT